MNSNTKQVIVVRKDLNMRTGKICSQTAHASMSFLTKDMCEWEHPGVFCVSLGDEEGGGYAEVVRHWLQSFRKICTYVESEDELLALHLHALSDGLVSHLITDSGLTEFDNVPTDTCIAIGPHWDEDFEGITDHLPLL